MAIMTREISNDDDVIDSRNVIARIEELEAEIEQLTEMRERALIEQLTGMRERALSAALSQDEMRDLAATVEDNAGELAALRELADEGANSAEDWQFGATLIRHSYFTEYAQELAEDIGAIDADAPWPARHIDWDAAADALKVDYSEIEFDGVTYYVR